MPTYTSPSVLNVGGRNYLHRILDRQVYCTQLQMDSCSVHSLNQLYFHVRRGRVFEDIDLENEDSSVVRDRRYLDECDPGTIPWFTSFGNIIGKLPCLEIMYFQELDNHAALLGGFFHELKASRYLNEVHFMAMDFSHHNYAHWNNALDFKQVVFQKCSIHANLGEIFYKDEEGTTNSCELERITFIQCDFTTITSLPQQLSFAEQIAEVPSLRLVGFCRCHYNDYNQRSRIEEAMDRAFSGRSVEVLFDLEEPTTLTQSL